MREEIKKQLAHIPSHAFNLLSGHRFDDFADLSFWEEEYNCDDFEISPRRAGALFGNAAALFRSYNDTATNSGISQTVQLQKGGTYVFSAYVRTLGKGIHSTVHSVEPGIYLRIRTPDRVLAQSQRMTQAEEYTRICVFFTARANETVKAEIKMDGQGSALVDGAQLEYEVLRPYNLLNNAGVTNGLSGWQCYPHAMQSSCENFDHGIRLPAAPGQRSYICQSVPIEDFAGENATYTFSAFAYESDKFSNTFHKKSPPVIRIYACVVYADHFHEEHDAEFQSCGNGYAKAEVTFSPIINHTAERIDVFCEYSNHFGYAEFGNLCLIKKT